MTELHRELLAAQVVRLPTAATNYVAVRKSGRRWRVELVTPCEGGRPIRTTLVTAGNGDAAVTYASATAARMQRPLRLPRGGA
jgi:hypothetical protein